MNPNTILKRLKASSDISKEELVQMIYSLEAFEIRSRYMEHVKTKCLRLIIARLTVTTT